VNVPLTVWASVVDTPRVNAAARKKADRRSLKLISRSLLM